ncbi:MAG TPA: dihydropteroate synthase [Actinomycetota bacterium]|nr:dihydropteroate synthase [Actinomycetota bacterium]
MKLRCRDRVISLDRTAVMGVLNVTPDSFSDGGLWFDPQRAVAHAVEMVDAGADIVDVGGESTRPGADPVSEDEEMQRVLPVIETLVGSTDAPISIDTRKPSVARAALDSGAVIVNDTGGEEGDPAMAAVAAETGAAMIVMHSRGTPATMRSLTDYSDVVRDVGTFLGRRAGELQSAGVPRDSIVLDPGYGFAKTSQQSLVMLNRLEEHVALGYPVVVGTSRKSFIGAVLDLSEDHRVEGTAATVAWAVMKGAHIVRVHDVVQMVRVVRMTEAIRDAGEQS